MRISGALAGVLWSMALVACGRIGFDERSASMAAELDLPAECGIAVPPSVDLVITNTGIDDLAIVSATASEGFTIATALPLTIAPGDQAALAIGPPASVIGTDRAGTVKSGALVLTMNAGPPYRVALRAVVRGANIDFVDSGGVTVTQVMFADTTGACPGSQPMTLANTGNEAARVAYGGFTGLVGVEFGGFTSGSIDAGSAPSLVLATQTDSACAGAGNVSYTVTGPTCTTTPVVLQTSLDITGASGSCSCGGTL